MQNVSFRNVEEFLEFLPEDELKVTELLRKIIFNCLPQVIEKLSYNVPFYKHHKNFCFIWPASVLWGKTKSYAGVRLGFTNGNQLLDETGYLDKGDRKQVYWKDFKSLMEIDMEFVRLYIFEAIMIDEQLKNKSNGIQRKISR
ncbi:MAG: DUF1801 domain-containing protein [Chitinophagaceae bacterium]